MDDKPELKWVSVKDLYIDKSYQRTTDSRASQKNIKAMVSDFRWSLCGALTVYYVAKTKKYAVVDGQHRLAAARQCGAQEMPCMVVTGHDEVVMQAKAFSAINRNRVALNSLASYHAAVAAGDSNAVSLKQILDECKITIPPYPIPNSQTEPRQTQAVGTLAKMIGRYHDKDIKLSLKIIPEAYGQKKGMLRASMLKMVAEYSKLHPDLDRNRLMLVLQKLDPKEFEESAAATVRMNGGRAVTVMVEALERLYKSAERKSA